MNYSFLGYSNTSYPMSSSLAVGTRDSSNVLPPEEQAALFSAAFEGSGISSMSSHDWHAKMSQVFGYASSDTKSPQYVESQKIFENLRTGNWSDLGLNVETVRGSDMESGGVAAFLGGDTATSGDDKIVINQDWLNKAQSGDAHAQKTLNNAIVEEVMHGLERKVHGGKSGDVQVDSSGQIKFMEQGEGAGFDEGKFARELLNQPGLHGFEDLKLQSMYEDHGNVYMNGESISAEYNNQYNPHAHPIDSVANDNKNHSVRWRINDQDWDNIKINQAFDGPEAFEKIWHHSDNDKDLEGWLNNKNLNGTRNKTEGVTAYVGWVLDQADPVKAPKAQEQKDKLLRDGGLLSHNDKWINQMTNEEIDGIDPNLLKHLSVEQLVTMKGSRSGSRNVQEALRLKFAEDPLSQEQLKHYFAQSNNGTDFLNKLSDGEIGNLNANVLKAIPPVQIQAAKGGRSNAALARLESADKSASDAASNSNASQLSGAEIATALRDRLGDKSQELTTDYFDNYFRGALGAEPSGDKANSPREIEIFEAMAAENTYTGWESMVRSAGGEDAVKSFRASELGMDFARWSLRSNENGNGADATTNQAMGNELSRKLLGENGNNLANMSAADQQWYLDNWILPNQGLEENLVTSLSIPAQAVATAKAANGGKLPANAGPLVEYLDGINELSAEAEDELVAGAPGRNLQGAMEASSSSTALRQAYSAGIRNRFGNAAASTTARSVAGGAASTVEEAAGAAGATAASEAMTAGLGPAGAMVAGATAAMNYAHNTLAAGHQEGGDGAHFNPNADEPTRMRGGAGGSTSAGDVSGTQGAGSADTVSDPELITQWGSYDLVDIYNKTHHADFDLANATDEEIEKYKQWQKFVTGGKSGPTATYDDFSFKSAGASISGMLLEDGNLTYAIKFDKNNAEDLQKDWPSVKGADLYTKMMLHFGNGVKQIDELWINDNARAYWKAVKNGSDGAKEAPFETFSGKMAQKFGFSEAVNVEPDPSSYNTEDILIPNDPQDPNIGIFDESTGDTENTRVSFVKPKK